MNQIQPTTAVVSAPVGGPVGVRSDNRPPAQGAVPQAWVAANNAPPSNRLTRAALTLVRWGRDVANALLSVGNRVRDIRSQHDFATVISPERASLDAEPVLGRARTDSRGSDTTLSTPERMPDWVERDLVDLAAHEALLKRSLTELSRSPLEKGASPTDFDRNYRWRLGTTVRAIVAIVAPLTDPKVAPGPGAIAMVKTALDGAVCEGADGAPLSLSGALDALDAQLLDLPQTEKLVEHAMALSAAYQTSMTPTRLEVSRVVDATEGARQNWVRNDGRCSDTRPLTRERMPEWVERDLVDLAAHEALLKRSLTELSRSPWEKGASPSNFDRNRQWRLGAAVRAIVAIVASLTDPKVAPGPGAVAMVKTALDGAVCEGADGAPLSLSGALNALEARLLDLPQTEKLVGHAMALSAAYRTYMTPMHLEVSRDVDATEGARSDWLTFDRDHPQAQSSAGWV